MIDKVITTRDLILGVLRRWDRTYKKPHWIDDADKHKTRERLAALDLDVASAADVEAAIGNDSWTRLTCEECKGNQTAVRVFAASIDDDEPGIQLCLGCLRQGVDDLEKIDRLQKHETLLDMIESMLTEGQPVSRIGLMIRKWRQKS